MGAVVALTVVVMGHVGAPVGVVKGKGDLAADVRVLRRQAVVLPGGVQAVQHLRHGAAVQHGGVRVWVGLKGGMVRVQPGVNDGHHRPRAVVTSGPCGVRPHHIQRGQVLPGGHRLSAPGAVRRGKALRRVDGHYAVQCPNAVQSIIGHDHRHGVDRHEIAVLRRQAVCSGQLGDLLQQCVLLRGNVRPADGTLSLRRGQHRCAGQLHNGLHRRFSLRSVQTSGNVRHNVGGLKGNGGSLLRCSRPGGTNCPCQQGRRQKCRDLFSHGYRPFRMQKPFRQYTARRAVVFCSVYHSVHPETRAKADDFSTGYTKYGCGVPIRRKNTPRFFAKRRKFYAKTARRQKLSPGGQSFADTA